MIFESEGAMAISTRPHGFDGSPELLRAVSSVQVLPPSAVRKNPVPLVASGPSPPERNVQPLRRKSHVPAKRTFGSLGSMSSPAQPVERFTPFKISDQFFPPSVVL